MAHCIACGAELEPPVRAPHTVYVKSLYRIAGQDYCRHPRHQGRRGRRRDRRGQARRWPGGNEPGDVHRGGVPVLPGMSRFGRPLLTGPGVVDNPQPGRLRPA